MKRALGDSMGDWGVGLIDGGVELMAPRDVTFSEGKNQNRVKQITNNKTTRSSHRGLKGV